MTWPALLLGVGLAVVMGAANVYLGLRVGMTVSAAIPAAVMALAILNGVLRRSDILEANMVQTGASAGEALAAGVIFTVPALVILGVWKEFDFWTTTAIAASGGVLGSLLMIPMRRVFIVDSPDLPFPEGVACAEVLKTARRVEDSSSSDGAGASAAASTGASLIFLGLSIGGVFKMAQSYFGLIQNSVEAGVLLNRRVFFLGADMAPALVAVGAIVGLPIASQIFLGGAISWLIAIPAAFPVESADVLPIAFAKETWSSQVRYLGVGAMVVGGVVSIWRVRRGLIAAASELGGLMRPKANAAPGDVSHGAVPSTERNLSAGTIALLAALTTFAIAAVYYSLLKSIGVTLLTTAVMLLMAFFFTAVASYLVGLVGSSNSPVSGMTITAVLGTGAVLYLFRRLGLLTIDDTQAIVATLGVAGVICCVASTSGDTSNDLKTGWLVGATPRNQQIMQVLCVLASAFVMAPVLTVLHEGSLANGTGGIGGAELSAPQAVLFSKLAEGMFAGQALPWTMIAVGAAIGAALVLADLALHRMNVPFRLHVMPVAVGMYLPFGVAPPILLGGVLHFVLTRRQATSEETTRRLTLGASGLIAGESLVGVLLGLLAYLGYSSWSLTEGWNWPEAAWQAVSLLALFAVSAWLAYSARRGAA
jgi:putative OPT family oligopeptide transporter